MSTNSQPEVDSSSSTAASSTDKRVAEARAAVTASLSSVGSSYDASLASRAADLHANSKAISKQEAELQKQTANLAKQNDKLAQLAQKSTKQLNEIGDVQNWAETIERELLVVEETLRLVEGRESIETASGTGGLHERATGQDT